jgi:hypothetical protein
LKCELDPIDHERAKMKLKMLLEQQLKNATGDRKTEIERKIAEIEHEHYRFKEQKSIDVNANSRYSNVWFSV